ncbi:hypothetical protein KA183_06750 [bacterium]|nr:hypothetical protein [bacterium]
MTSNNKKESNQVSLADTIKQIATDLKSLPKDPKDAVMQFESCEVEIKVKTTKGAGARVNIWVVDIEGGKDWEHAHTIRLKFNAIRKQSLLTDVNCKPIATVTTPMVRASRYSSGTPVVASKLKRSSPSAKSKGAKLRP